MKRFALRFVVGIALVAIALVVLGRLVPQSVDVSASVVIDAPREAIWQLASDFEGAFEDSNPSHRGTIVLSEPKEPLRDGLRFRQEEYVGGLRGVLRGEVFDVYPGERFRWRAVTDYSLGGAPIATVEEGGDFRIEATRTGEGVRVSHRVWGVFPDTPYGRTLGWVATSLLGMEASAERHTRTELEYFRDRLRTGGTVASEGDLGISRGAARSSLGDEASSAGDAKGFQRSFPAPVPDATTDHSEVSQNPLQKRP